MKVTIRKAQGFALIDLIFVCGIIGLLCSIALPRLLLAKQSAGAASAIGSMRAINSAQLTFALTCGSGFYAPNLTTLGTRRPGATRRSSAAISARRTPSPRPATSIQLDATASPARPPRATAWPRAFRRRSRRRRQLRFFATNANGMIYEHTSSLFASMPEVGEPPVGHPLLR